MTRTATRLPRACLAPSSLTQEPSARTSSTSSLTSWRQRHTNSAPVAWKVRHSSGTSRVVAVQRHQPPSPIPRPLHLPGRQRPGDLHKQRPQRRRSKPCPGPGDRTLVRDLPAALPAPGPRQPLHQQPLTLLAPAGLGDHPIHQLGREGPGQHPDRDLIRQAGHDRWLGLAGAWHPRVITPDTGPYPGRDTLVGPATTPTVQ
jgi:hypothetical protein